MQMQREWTSQEGMMPSLSISQPFCQAILLGKKSIELRTWGTSYRGLIALHAGKSWYGGVKIPGRVSNEQLLPILRAMKRMSLPTKVSAYPTGAIIGIARLVDCIRFTEESYEQLEPLHRSDAPWSPRDIGWQFTDVQALSEPITDVRGYLGLFPVDEAEILARLTRQEAR